MRLRHLAHRLVDTEHKTAPFYEDGEYLVIRTNNVNKGRLMIGEDSKFTDGLGFIEWTRRGAPRSGDIILTREAPAGEACVFPRDLHACIGQRTVLVKTNLALLNPEFCIWALYGGPARAFIDQLSQGSTVAHLNMADIGDIPLYVPPYAGQEDIAALLATATGRLDRLIAIELRQLQLFAERRQALITAAVTGQIDIPGAAAA